MPLDIFPVGNRKETPMIEDEKDFQEWWKYQLADYENMYGCHKAILRMVFLEGRRTLREKIKSDPSIGKLIVEGDWPESPDY